MGRGKKSKREGRGKGRREKEEGKGGGKGSVQYYWRTSVWLVVLSSKRSRPSESETVKKNYKKWLRDFDQELKTLSWLECETVFTGGKKPEVHAACVLSLNLRSKPGESISCLDTFHK